MRKASENSQELWKGVALKDALCSGDTDILSEHRLTPSISVLALDWFFCRTVQS